MRIGYTYPELASSVSLWSSCGKAWTKSYGFDASFSTLLLSRTTDPRIKRFCHTNRDKVPEEPRGCVTQYPIIWISELLILLRLFFLQSGERASSKYHVKTGNRGASRSHHRRPIGLPRNPGGCEKRSQALRRMTESMM